MKNFRIAILCTFASIFAKYSINAAALPFSGACNYDIKSLPNGLNAQALNTTLRMAISRNEIEPFKAILQEKRFLQKIDNDDAYYLWKTSQCQKNPAFRVELLAHNEIIQLLASYNFNYDMSLAAINGDVLTLKAMLTSRLVLKTLQPLQISQAFVFAAQFGNEEILKVFLTKTELFDLAQIINSADANSALECANGQKHFNIIILLLENDLIAHLVSPETLLNLIKNARLNEVIDVEETITQKAILVSKLTGTTAQCQSQPQKGHCAIV